MYASSLAQGCEAEGRTTTAAWLPECGESGRVKALIRWKGRAGDDITRGSSQGEMTKRKQELLYSSGRL